MTTLVPPIKCQGIKTKLVPWIKATIPADFEGRWVEPFMGSGVVAFNVKPQKALLADSNPHLIHFYQAIAKGDITAANTRHFLEQEGEKLRHSEGEYYYTVRDRFNQKGDPLDFLFLNRAGFNGMIRFNRKGGFNVPFCRKPHRFAPAYITKICNQVKAISEIMASGNYEFRHQDYATTLEQTQACDLIYCDPPYIARHADYFNGWDETHEKHLAQLLAATKARFMLSTWYGNEFRENLFFKQFWSEYDILTREHYYHVGAKEKNRNPMIEALVLSRDFN